MQIAHMDSPLSSGRTFCYRHSLLVGKAIHVLFCSWSGAVLLATHGLASDNAPDVAPPSSTEKATGRSLLRGIDLSSSAGEPAIGSFDLIKQQGYRAVIVSGWGGVNRNSHARFQLSGARGVGLLTAGYCYLNFASTCDGGCQVREALAAFNTEAASLGFLAIDVESDAWNQLSPGLQREPPDASAQRQAVARIAEAVQEVERVGLRPVIYTKKSYWKRVTGNTTVFSAVPLWWTQAGPPSLSGPDLSSPSWTFGGWTSYVGKQYILETIVTASAIPVDLDVFEAAAFASSNPAYIPLPPQTDPTRIAVNLDFSHAD